MPKVESAQSVSTLGDAVVMPEELMPAEEDQEPEPCPNCGKVGGDCEELAARQKELNTINVKLGK